MYLKCVEIDGFKSFADKIKLDFNMGITSIVGPNGSGKSNILDAILWVLGEQSYKNIRAKESSDIIFSGGKNKKPRNTATVSLYIDNEDNSLEIESEIVKVTRKINSKGENEYYINDERCRLKDVNELFLDTGVGKSAYSVIGQGKVDKIISASNKEIRSIVEEAAGTKKIKLRKEEATKKLGKVEVETEKINLIIGELEENKNKIEKQAEKALRYKKLDKEIKTLKKSILLEDYKINKNILDSLTGDKNNHEQTLEILVKEFDEKEEKLEKINEKRSKLNLEIDALAEKNINLKRDLDKLVNDKVLYTERVKGYTREVETKEENIKKLGDKIVSKEKEIDSLNSKKEIILEELKKLEGAHSEFDKNLKELEKQQRDIEIEIGVQKEHIMESEVGRLKLIAEIENSQKRTKSSGNKIKELQLEKEGYDKKLLRLKEELLGLEKKKEQIEKEISGIDKTIEEAEKQIELLSEEINKIYEKRKETSYNLSRHGAKLENLRKLEANNEGFFKGVKAILNAKVSGVHGAFISLIDIPEYLEAAIESSAGGSLQDLVVENSEVAKKCIKYLREKNLGRASFLAFDTIKVSSPQKFKALDGILGYASELVGYDNKYKKAVEFVLGNILVVKDMEVALKISRENQHRGNIVTLKGEVISGRGRITGGENIRSASSVIFERKKEIKKLSEIVLNLNTEFNTLDKEHEKLSKKMESFETKLENIDDLREEKEDLLRENLRSIREIEENISKEGKRVRVVEQEIEEEEIYLTQYKKQIEEGITQRSSLEEFLKNSKEKLGENNTKLVSIKAEIENLNHSYSNTKINYLNKKESSKQLQREIERSNLGLEELLDEKKKEINSLNNLNSEIESIKTKLENIEKDYFNENTRYEKEFFEIKEKKKEQEELEKNEKNMILGIKNLEKEILVAENKIKSLIEKVQKTKGSIEEIEKELEPLREIKEVSLEENITKSKEKLYNLEVKLKSLGIVNLLAIEEFEELTKKYEFITSQRDDLIKSKMTLLSLVKEIEKIMETKFLSAYKEINKNFEYMCREVLNNSVGKLTLLDPENPLESGIDLMVKFKNKKSQSITLLSGGEKSMVAIAFIMALFMYKPSPFTFFDEIEAALDETNIKKLIGKLKEFTDKSQFILITHNKETMRRSDTLYGVTMNKELGESKIISVKV